MVQQSLLNDTNSNNFDLLLITEPYIFTTCENDQGRVTHHPYWTAYTPSIRRNTEQARHSFRSLIWMNKRLQGRQVPIKSPDVTAVLVKLRDTTVMITSIYIPNRTGTVELDTATIRDRLEMVQVAWRNTQEATREDVEIIVGGDFNRHDTLWGGDDIANDDYFHGGEQIHVFMQTLGLQSLLPRGTKTYQRPDGIGVSTIDLVLASEQVTRALIRCRIYGTDHGSDHRAIEIETAIGTMEEIPVQPRRMYDKADWEKIAQVVGSHLPVPVEIHSIQELEEAVESLLTTVKTSIEEMVPIAKPSPYSKRWWDKTLTELRHEYNTWRNQWTTLRRRGERPEWIHQNVLQAKQLYFKEIKCRKRLHWREFLDNTDNVWKAQKYLNQRTNYEPIPRLTANRRVADTDAEKAQMLMDCFFPPQVPPTPERNGDQPTRQLDFSPLTRQEVKAAILHTKAKGAPGIDGILNLIWQRLWPTIGEHVFRVYEASLKFSYIPNSWKAAKIVILRKQGKADYTLPKAYRPISLLPTISKGLESVIATRISDLAEEHGLLPNNHFGARRRRSCEQALNVLIEKVHDAWRTKKVLSLITFDVQGAYNGVNHEIILDRLRKRRIPENIISWVGSFCDGRTVSISLGNFCSEAVALDNVGLPQGSPLSPILYIFYNADLVDQPINDQHGAIGFVDDYSAWVVGPTAEANTAQISRTIIPAAEAWAAASGATFEAEKSEIVHFTRNKKKAPRPHLPIWLNGKAIAPQHSVKLLGVILDQRLDMKEHANRAATRAMKQCLALQRLKGLRPKAMRQLYIATVVPSMDYALSVWYVPGRKGTRSTIKALEPVQRLGCRAITSAFRTVPTAILESEAGVWPTEIRLLRKLLGHTVNLHTLPLSHPFWKCKHKVNSQKGTFMSPMKRLLQLFKEELGSPNNYGIETIYPFCIPPYVENPLAETTIEPDRQKAIQQARDLSWNEAVFTDGSGRRGVLGIGAAWLGREGQPVWEKSERVGSDQDGNIHVTELWAIQRVAEFINDLTPPSTARQFTILSDSQAALKALKCPRQQSGQSIIRRIIQTILQASRRGIRIRTQWVPGHEGITGNEHAHQLAQNATDAGGLDSRILQKSRLKSAALRLGKQRIKDQWLKQFEKGNLKGRHAQQVDKARPRRHTMKLYGGLSKSKAAILAQLRTGHIRLGVYLKRFHIEPSETCPCGQNEESIRHFLFDCPLWQRARRTLRQKIGERWGDLSYMLGGWGDQVDRASGKLIDGPKEYWKPNMTAVRAVIDFVDSTGRLNTTWDMAAKEDDTVAKERRQMQQREHTALGR